LNKVVRGRIEKILELFVDPFLPLSRFIRSPISLGRIRKARQMRRLINRQKTGNDVPSLLRIYFIPLYILEYEHKHSSDASVKEGMKERRLLSLQRASPHQQRLVQNKNET